MKRIIMTAAALALLTGAAQAGETITQAEWVNTLYVYQTYCRSLGISQRGFEQLFNPVPNDVFKAALDRVHADFSRDKAGFCERSQALIAANRKWNFQ